MCVSIYNTHYISRHTFPEENHPAVVTLWLIMKHYLGWQCMSSPPPTASRQEVVLPSPTTLLPQRPSIECFLRPSTHLVGLATMPHNLGLAQWVRQKSGKFLSLRPPAKANSWPFGWEKGGPLGPVPVSWGRPETPPCPKDEANCLFWSLQPGGIFGQALARWQPWTELIFPF